MTTLAEKLVDLKILEESLDQYSQNEKSYAPWMAQIIINLPHDAAYKKLSPQLREEIETVIAAVE